MSFILITSICFLLNFQATISQTDSSMVNNTQSPEPDTVYVKSEHSNLGNLIPTIVGGLLAGLAGVFASYVGYKFKQRREEYKELQEYQGLLNSVIWEFEILEGTLMQTQSEIEFVLTASEDKLVGAEGIPKFDTDYLEYAIRLFYEFDFAKAQSFKNLRVLISNFKNANRELTFRYTKYGKRLYGEDSFKERLYTNAKSLEHRLEELEESLSMIIGDFKKEIDRVEKELNKF